MVAPWMRAGLSLWSFSVVQLVVNHRYLELSVLPGKVSGSTAAVVPRCQVGAARDQGSDDFRIAGKLDGQVQGSLTFFVR